MHRRRVLKLTAGTALMLALTGGALTLVRPQLAQGRLAAGAREVFIALAQAVLEGSLPAGAQRREAALDQLVPRIEALIGQLPPHAQGELSSLLALLASSPGRVAFAGLASPWQEARPDQIQSCLQAWRTSRLALKRQAYQALHDIIGGAYFSNPVTWPLLGYPGPGVTFS